ncbi:MAG: hypothetical protein ACM37W_11480 [Actinomycetota bacterium]
MHLKDYPKAIATRQYELLQLNHEIRRHSQSVNLFTASIDRKIAYDPNLKNEAQRKARRFELMQQDSDYLVASQALEQVTDQRDSLLIELDLLRNQFSVLRLELREALTVKEHPEFEV